MSRFRSLGHTTKKIMPKIDENHQNSILPGVLYAIRSASQWLPVDSALVSAAFIHASLIFHIFVHGISLIFSFYLRRKCSKISKFLRFSFFLRRSKLLFFDDQNKKVLKSQVFQQCSFFEAIPPYTSAISLLWLCVWIPGDNNIIDRSEKASYRIFFF